MKRTFAFLTLATLMGMSLAAAEVGQPAPGFAATDINGQTHRLSDYKDKIIVLESYNQDCPFCHNHYKTGAIQELQKDLAAKGVIWFVVNSVGPQNPGHRSRDAARKEWDKEKIHATAWLDDSSGELGKKYGMRTTPHMFVIDQHGVLAYTGAIDNRPQPEGDPRTARNYVREAVEKLLTGQKVEVTQTRPYGCGVKYGT